jgi:hypothetical protein
MTTFDSAARVTRINEDRHGNVLARANGGFKTHIILKDQIAEGPRAVALCGHQPARKGGTQFKSPRGKWLHVNNVIGTCSCDKCAAKYLEMYP